MSNVELVIHSFWLVKQVGGCDTGTDEVDSVTNEEIRSTSDYEDEKH